MAEVERKWYVIKAVTGTEKKVKQTSQRILDFAVALTGGDPSKIEAMRDAFKKGYEMAEKAWGGELPDICKDTYDAVFKGFDEMAEKAKVEA